MPVDKWRNVGPDDSVDYRLYNTNPTNFDKELDILIKDGTRLDERGIAELRSVYVKNGIVPSIKGSTYFEVGATKILVTVYEPREIPRLAEFCASGEVQVEFRFAPFSGPNRRPHVMQSDEKDLALTLKRALEPAVCRSEFPNCQVDIYVLVVDNDGSCLAAAITASGLALANAGIPMYDTVAGVSMSVYNDHIFLDPTLREETFCISAYTKGLEKAGTITLAYLPSIGQISAYTHEGALTQQQLLNNLELLIERCNSLSLTSNEIMKEDVLIKCRAE